VLASFRQKPNALYSPSVDSRSAGEHEGGTIPSMSKVTTLGKNYRIAIEKEKSAKRH